jgi:peptide/nickel transport system permease protein
MTTADFLHETEQEALAAGAPGAVPPVARSPLELFWRRLREDRVALAALGFIVVLVAVALLAPLVVKVLGAPPPNQQSPRALDAFGTATGPSGDHVFGVDGLGRDVFSRVVYGARVSLFVAVAATGISVAIGIVMGMLAGFYRGAADMAISRAMDVLLAFPVLLLAIGLASACSFGNGCFWGIVQPGISVVVFTIAFANWPYIGRVIRGQVLSLREKEFVEAARSLGASDRRVIFGHILPNLVAPIVVYSSLVIPQNVLFEAALDFLGVGVEPSRASWGAMIADAVGSFDTAWWYMLFPGLALLFTVLAFNLVGDGLQDALNPRSRA